MAISKLTLPNFLSQLFGIFNANTDRQVTGAYLDEGELILNVFGESEAPISTGIIIPQMVDWSFTQSDVVDYVFTKTHELSTLKMMFQLIDNNGFVKNANDLIQIVSSNQVKLTLNDTITGTWIIRVIYTY